MKIALAGNPNSGKTTMYNALTGKNEKVGNWAGVTVESNQALLKRNFYDINEDKIKSFSNKQCEFGYRDSYFKRHEVIILGASIVKKYKNR